MAVIRQIEARPGLDTAAGSRPSTRIDDSIGQGLRQVGGAISQAGNAFAEIEMRRERMRMQNADFRAEQGLIRFGDDFALEYAKTQQGIDPSGEGFTEAIAKQYGQRAEQFMQTVPENLRPKFAELVKTQRETFLNKAAAAEVDQRNTWFRQGIVERQERLQSQVFNDPSIYDAALQDGLRAIDTSGLPEVEKQALRESWQETLAVTLGEREVRDAEADPTSAANAAGRLGVRGAVQGDMGAYRDAIASIESKGSGDYAAVGPRHKTMGRALGRYQIMEKNIGPWSKEALGREITPEQFMASPQLQDAIFDHKFGQYVKRFGPEGAAQAWFAGPGGVGKTSRKDVLGTDVGSYGRKFTRALGKVNAESEPDPRYASLSLEKRLEIYDRTQAAAQRGQTIINAQMKAQYDQHKGAMELGIETGDVGSELTILQDTILNDAHKADLISAFRSKNQDRIATADALAAFEAGALRVDPYDTKGRKTVDNMFKEIAKTVPADQIQQITEEIVRQTGVVPQVALNGIRSGLESNNISEVAQAAEAAGRIQAINPSVLGRRDGGDQVSKRADLYNTLTNTMGYTKEEAARRISDLNDPEKVRARDALLSSEPVKKMLKDVDADDIAKGFSGITLLGWQLGENDEQRAGMVAEYKRFLEETILDANGDQEIAKDLANKRFQRLYGASDFTLANSGIRTVITRLPPEKTYDPLPDGSFDYIGQQLEDALKAEGVEFDEVRLKEYDETESSVRNGAPAVYQVWYQQNGQWKLYNLPFEANYGEALTQYEAEQQALMDERQKAMEANRAKELRRFPEGRDGPERFSNDKLYYGIAGEDSPMGRAIRSRREEAKKRKERNAPFIEQDQRDRDAFNALDPIQQRERAMDDYLNGPLLPGSR